MRENGRVRGKNAITGEDIEANRWKFASLWGIGPDVRRNDPHAVFIGKGLADIMQSVDINMEDVRGLWPPVALEANPATVLAEMSAAIVPVIDGPSTPEPAKEANNKLRDDAVRRALKVEGNQGGRFRPGRSGNPSGKPRGVRHRVTLMAESLMEGSAESVVQAVLAAAREGDMVAARLVLERIAPVRKGRPVPLPLPPVTTAGEVLAALGSTVKAMADGEITPDEAATVASVLEINRKAIETAELESRITALEERNQK